MVDQEIAVNRFVDGVFEHVYRSSIECAVSLLREGPPGRCPLPEDVSLHRWFTTLGERDQGFVIQAIRESVEQAVFDFLVLLDNKIADPPLDDTDADYALYLQTYENNRALKSNVPEAAIRLNQMESSNDLHDQFCLILGENEGE
jgi:hypothetical protein